MTLAETPHLLQTKNATLDFFAGYIVLAIGSSTPNPRLLARARDSSTHSWEKSPWIAENC